MFILSSIRRPSHIVSTAVKNSVAFNVFDYDIRKRGKKSYKSKDQGGKDGEEVDKGDCCMPPEVGPPCECKPDKKPKKKDTLWKMGLRIIDGGTNFGAPFRRLLCKEDKNNPCHFKVIDPPDIPDDTKKDKIEPKKEVHDLRKGVQVALLSADTELGQYLALLLKQCPIIRRLHLFGACQKKACTRSVENIVKDLELMDTSTIVGSFSTEPCLLPCLCDSNIVVILDSGVYIENNCLEERFRLHAPTVKKYAEAIACVCPDAFILCCAHPVDCLVPLIAEILDIWCRYSPSRLMGSLAVPEMRATTLAARILTLEPHYLKVPCVGGTEGNTLVPLFSKTMENFFFCDQTAEKLTNAIRNAEYGTIPDPCMNYHNLCEAHAIFGLILNISHALMRTARPVVTGFVQNDFYQVVYPNKFVANPVELGSLGVMRNLTLPKMSEFERTLLDQALMHLNDRVIMAHEWFAAADFCNPCETPGDQKQQQSSCSN